MNLICMHSRHQRWSTVYPGLNLPYKLSNKSVMYNYSNLTFTCLDLKNTLSVPVKRRRSTESGNLQNQNSKVWSGPTLNKVNSETEKTKNKMDKVVRRQIHNKMLIDNWRTIWRFFLLHKWKSFPRSNEIKKD